jgi:hypothetical protein
MGGKQNGLVVLAAKDGWRISVLSQSRVLEFNTTFKFKFNRDKCKGTKQRQT